MNIHIIIYIISAVIFLVLFIILIRFLTDKKRLLAAEIKGRYNATALLTPTEAAFFLLSTKLPPTMGCISSQRCALPMLLRPPALRTIAHI